MKFPFSFWKTSGGGGPIPAPLVTRSGQSLNGPIVTSSADTTGANFIIAYASGYSNTGTVTDNKGNTYTPLTLRNPTSSFVGQFFYCQNATVGTNHVFTLTIVGGVAVTFIVSAFSNMLTAGVFDAENFATASGPITATLVGSITPAQANEVLFAAVTIGDNGTVPAGITDSYTQLAALSWVAGTAIGGGLWYKVVTSTAPLNPTITITNPADNLIGASAAFKY